MRIPRASTILGMLLLAAAPLPADPPEEETATERAVTFETDDGVTIHGTYQAATGEPGPAVVLLPMYGRDRATWEPVMPSLLEAGIAVLAIDLRGQGESVRRGEETLDYRTAREEGGENHFLEAHRDVAVAVEFLVGRGHPRARIGLLGASVGCSVAVDYARRDRAIPTLALLSPGTDYLNVPTVEQIAELENRAVLFFAPESERARCEAVTAALPESNKRMAQLVPGNPHGTEMFGPVRGIEGFLALWFQCQLNRATAVAENPPTRVTLVTSEGEIKIELYPEAAPITVTRFLELARAGFYDDNPVHRVSPGFVIQTGAGTNPEGGRPPVTIPDETPGDASFDRPGRISMARTANIPNSATTQFFISLRPTPHLDPGFTVFGQVVEGMDVVERIAATPLKPRSEEPVNPPVLQAVRIEE